MREQDLLQQEGEGIIASRVCFVFGCLAALVVVMTAVAAKFAPVSEFGAIYTLLLVVMLIVLLVGAVVLRELERMRKAFAKGISEVYKKVGD